MRTRRESFANRLSWFVLFGVVPVLLLLLLQSSDGFVTRQQLKPNRSSLFLSAKKKRNKPAKGFGKVEVEESPAVASTKSVETASSPPSRAAGPSSGLQSVDNGSTSLPTVEVDDDSTTSPEDRAAKLLREKYGLKTLEEQQLDAKQLEARKEQAKKWSEIKKKAELDEDFDIMQILPAPVLVFIDRFLKGGVAVTGLLFIAAGMGITLEAWSKTTGNPLPENIDNFIVNTVEPNFTPGLLVLLAFSVSLGAFAALQLGSQGATYREDD